ncbi:CD209 antigen-like protein E [Amphiprion ocellaris]|uniref:C-type lectin domain-containing protein n=1 Tax=Amphiprion ocellaris TaxID=80972 RepID=A0AAQ5XP71_AMPOC|nr:CD209 antigen-like protein E [Amphiprion ocellaris]
MVRAAHREPSEIITEYVNLPDVPARSRLNKVGEETPAAAGTKLIRLVAVSFGLLCIMQVILNISFRLALYKKTSDIEIICNNVSETDELRKLADHHFQQGWVYIRPSFYYISSTTKTWKDSRKDCLQRGADLVIIDSIEEQDFTRKFHKPLWIGLTEGGRKGEWQWVDGTPLTTSYWGTGEPNNFEGKTEDCVEIKFHDNKNSWNDIPCEDLNFWMCEKKVSL